MKILFFGNADFGLPTLNSLFESSHDLVGVVTNQDKKSGRGKSYRYTPIKKYSLDNNINLIEVEQLDDFNFQNKIEKISPDLIVVIAFRLLPVNIFTIPLYGTMNLHASLLPKYRGAAPIQRAILNGDSKTGVSTFLIDKKIDSGKLILQEKIKISKFDDFKKIHDKLSEIGPHLVIKSIEHILKNKPLIKQAGKPSYAKKIEKDELQINWNDDAKNIFNKIRAFSPYPGAFSYMNGKRIKIFCSKIENHDINNLLPGDINIKDNRLLAGTTSKTIEILQLQQEGKKRINAINFINGFLYDKKKSLKFEFKK